MVLSIKNGVFIMVMDTVMDTVMDPDTDMGKRVK